MKAKVNLSRERKHPKPPDKKPPLSKDELLRRLADIHLKSVHLIEGFNINAVPTLLLLHHVALNDDSHNDLLTLHMTDCDVEYCSMASAMEPTLQRLAAEVHDLWNEIDALSMGIVGEIEDYNAGQPEEARIPSRLARPRSSAA